MLYFLYSRCFIAIFVPIFDPNIREGAINSLRGEGALNRGGSTKLKKMGGGSKKFN